MIIDAVGEARHHDHDSVPERVPRLHPAARLRLPTDFQAQLESDQHPRPALEEQESVTFIDNANAGALERAVPARLGR